MFTPIVKILMAIVLTNAALIPLERRFHYEVYLCFLRSIEQGCITRLALQPIQQHEPLQLGGIDL